MTNILTAFSRSKTAQVAAFGLILAAGITYISLSSASTIISVINDNVTVTSVGMGPFNPQPCVGANTGARYHEHTIAVSNNPTEDTYVFDGAIFHNDAAGCSTTIDNPTIVGGSVSGKLSYAPGESGSLLGTFDTQAFNCGRVQYDFAFKQPGTPTMLEGNFDGLFYGIVVNYGVDCVAPTPKVCTPEITKSVDKASANQGDNVTYTLNINNSGTGDCNPTGIWDFLDANLTYVSSTSTANIGAGVYDGASHRVSWNAGVFTPGETGSVTVTARTKAAADCTYIVRNKGKVSPNNFQTFIYSNEVTTTVTKDCNVPQPCAGVSVTLGKTNEAVSAIRVTGNVVVGFAGTNVSATLTHSGSAVAVVNGQSVAYTIDRPAAGQSAVTRIYTLRGYVGNELCATKEVTVTAEPQTVVILPCEGVSGSLANADEQTTSTEVTGRIVVDLVGSNVTGRVTLDGSTADVTDGQSISYSISRPAAGQSAVSKTYTLKVYRSGEPCHTREVTVTAQPQDEPSNGGGGSGGRAKITRAKTAWNVTKNRDANNVVAEANNTITYTLTAANTGTRADRNFVFEDDISAVLELADLVSRDGAEYDSAKKTLTWGKVTVPAKGKVTKTFTVKIKSSLPKNTDCIISNTFGNTHRIGVACPKVSGTTTFVAPKTGAETVVITAFALMSVAGFAAYQLVRKQKVA